MDKRVRLGRLSLRADAAYCALTALLLLGFAGRVAESLGVAVRIIVIVAAGTGVWAVVLHLAARSAQLRPWLLGVLTVNVVVAGPIAGLALTRPRDAFSVLLLVVAAEVAAFAAGQVLALRPRAQA